MKKSIGLVSIVLIFLIACTATAPVANTLAPGTPVPLQPGLTPPGALGTTSTATPVPIPLTGPTTAPSPAQNSDNAPAGLTAIVNQTQGKKGPLGGMIVSQGGFLELIEGDARIDNGFVVLVGQIVNHSAKWAQSIRLDITLFDAKGAEIYRDRAYSATGGVAPQTAAPFKYLRDVTKVPGVVAGYSMVASAVETTARPGLAVQGLKAVLGADGDFTITASIVNGGQDACADPQVALLGKQPDGKLFDVVNIALMSGNDFLTSLAAGAKSDFTRVMNTEGKISAVDVLAGCN